MLPEGPDSSEMCWMGQKLMMVHNCGDRPEIPSDWWLLKHWHSTKMHSSTNTTTVERERERGGWEEKRETERGRVCERKNNVRREAEHSQEHWEGKIWNPSEREGTCKKYREREKETDRAWIKQKRLVCLVKSWSQGELCMRMRVYAISRNLPSYWHSPSSEAWSWLTSLYH